MDVYKIKATLQRSNPVLIREFTVPAQGKLADVGETLRILLGWEEAQSCRFHDGKTVIIADEALKVVFEKHSTLFCNLTSGKSKEMIWEFRLRFLGTDGQEQDYPQVLRSRGENLPQDVVSLDQFNLLQQNWNGTMRMYFNGFINSHPKEKFRFDTKSADRALKRQFSAAPSAAKSGNHPLELDYDHAVSLEVLVQSLTAQDLKEIGRRLELPVPSGLRKRDLSVRMTEELAKTETLDALLQAMTLNQYRAFRKICAGQGSRTEKGAMQEILVELTDCCYLDNLYSFWGDEPLKCARELLDAYQDWLDTADEPAYLRLALLRSSVVACARLYGCIDKESWKRLAPKSTKKLFTDAELNSAWDTVCVRTYTEELVPENTDLIFNMKELELDQAKKAAARLSGKELYAPTIAEIRQLESGGLLYPGAWGTELEKYLRTECKMDKNQAHQVHLDVYASLLSGMDPDEYARWIAPKLGMKGRIKMEKLLKLMRELAQVTRSRVYDGYTQLEMERMK